MIKHSIFLLLIFIFLIILLDSFILKENCKLIEGYMMVRPSFNIVYNTVMSPKFQPVNTYYKNFKYNQDFDPDSVFTQIK